MLKALEAESAKLAGSWDRHDSAMLRDYLVAGVEDPRVNLQSILTRHFLIRELAGERFPTLMEREYQFAAVMDWSARNADAFSEPADAQTMLRALRLGADNVEGTEIPSFVGAAFSALPASADGLVIPNYIEDFLLARAEYPKQDSLALGGEEPNPDGTAATVSRRQAVFDTFAVLWRLALGGEAAALEATAGNPAAAEAMNRDPLETGAPGGGSAPALPPKVLEAGCGSANDYRFLRAFGIAAHIDYTGFDLCRKNVENARALFPGIRFEEGNIFEIQAADRAYDLGFLHDVLEHLSLEGIHAAIAELSRVTRVGLCIGCFNVDEIPEHAIVPFDQYHWNMLSLARLRDSFAQHGFASRAIHIGTFLRKRLGCPYTHNPNAYTLILWRTRAAAVWATKRYLKADGMGLASDSVLITSELDDRAVAYGIDSNGRPDPGHGARSAHWRFGRSGAPHSTRSPETSC